MSTSNELFNDEMFDVEAVENGAWAPGPYGPGDERGSFNEVTPAKTAAALRLLDLSRPVKTYNLSEMLYNGFPALGDRGEWGRNYEQVLQVMGYQPAPDYEGLVLSTESFANNHITTHEERVKLTYNMGTKINGLTHVGVGEMYYNGFRGPEIAKTWGTSKLGIEKAGPIVTRGVLIDVVGYKVASGARQDYFEVPNGQPVLNSNYRITLEDILATLEWEGLGEDAITPGDAVLLRTGWRQLIEFDPDRYIKDATPGPFLRECRFMAARRPALVGIDVWVFGIVDPELDKGNPCCCHQEMFGKYGIRLGEAVPSDPLAADSVYEFVFCFNPNNAKGAVGGSTPPMALGQPAA